MNYNYLSIDIETTGLNPETCQVIEIAAIADNFTFKVPKEDLENYISHLPVFHCYVRHTLYKGEPYALAMHSKIFETLVDNDKDNILRADDVSGHFSHFIRENFPTRTVPRGGFIQFEADKVYVAGKNFGAFDLQFLKKLHLGHDFHHRSIDPAMLYFNPLTDTEIPSLKTCLERAGYGNKEVAHTAVEDAKDVIRVIRMSKLYQG